MVVQTILFDNSLWDTDSAINWLYDNGFVYNKVDYAKNYMRFRQIPPNNRMHYYSKDIGNGIILVIMYN